MSTITVIVPVYKVEPYLRRCVDSILAQTFTDFELILVDDGSPDKSGAICDEYAAKDSRVHVIHQPNGGLSAARNAGLDWAFTNSDSQWISFVDSDDWVHPRYLEYLYRAAEETGCRISVCEYEQTDGQRNAAEPVQTFEPRVVDGLAFFVSEKNVVATVAVVKLYDKTLFHDMRYPVGKIHEDEFVTWHLLAEAGNVAVMESKLYYYFVNTNGITRSQYSLKRLAGIEAYEQQRAFLRGLKNKTYYEQWIRDHLSWYCGHVFSLEAIGEIKERNRIRKLARSILFRNLNAAKRMKWEKKRTVIEACFPVLRHILIPGKNFIDISRERGLRAAIRHYWGKAMGQSGE